MAIITPTTYTAYLDQPDVKFHCSAVNASNIVWEIDGYIRPADDLAAQGIGVVTNRTLLESILTISSTTENNNTHIRCLTLIEKRNALYFIPSDEVVFHVQGQLANLTDSKLLFLILSYSVLQVHWAKCYGLRINSVGNYLHHLTWDLHQPST